MLEKKYQTMAFEKVSDNGLLLYGLDIFTFQIPIHTLNLDVPENPHVGKSITQCHFVV